MRGLTDMPRITLKSQATAFQTERAESAAREDRLKKEITALTGLRDAARSRVQELEAQLNLLRPHKPFVDYPAPMRIEARRRAMEAVSGF